MGIQDRDYYRNEGPSFLDSLIPAGLVCRSLICINVAVWVLQMIAMTFVNRPEGPGGAGWVTEWFCLKTDAVLHGEIWRLLTAAFLHSTDFHSTMGMTHLAFNMLCLWWFGTDLEQLYGRKEFLVFYLLAGVAGNVAYVGWHAMFGPNNPALGASGAVTALLVLCALHFPRRLVSIFGILPIPIWFFAVFSIAKDVVIFFAPVHIPIGVAAHLGGAVFAFAYWKYQRSILDIFRSFAFWKNLGSRSQLKIYRPEIDKEEPVAVSAPVSSYGMDEHLEAKLDAVLEKIATKGKESLTSQEEEVLKQAAEMYKRRRT